MTFLQQVQNVLPYKQNNRKYLSADHDLNNYSSDTDIIDPKNDRYSKPVGCLRPNLQSWVLEYSSSQGAFHVQQLQDSIRDNMMAALNGSSSDYLILRIFPNQEQCHEFSKKLLPYLRKIQPSHFSRLTLDDILNGNHFD